MRKLVWQWLHNLCLTLLLLIFSSPTESEWVGLKLLHSSPLCGDRTLHEVVSYVVLYNSSWCAHVVRLLYFHVKALIFVLNILVIITFISALLLIYCQHVEVMLEVLWSHNVKKHAYGNVPLNAPSSLSLITAHRKVNTAWWQPLDSSRMLAMQISFIFWRSKHSSLH